MTSEDHIIVEERGMKNANDFHNRGSLHIKAPDKFSHEFRVVKANNPYNQFVVEVSTGKVPSQLSSRYTSLKKAKDAVFKYIRGSKPTAVTNRNKRYAE
jgi:hypothetical protein